MGPYMETGNLSTHHENLPKWKQSHARFVKFIWWSCWKFLKRLLLCGFGQTRGQHRSHLLVYCLGTNSGDSCSKQTCELGTTADVSSDYSCCWCSLRLGKALVECCCRGFGLDGDWSFLPGLTSICHPPSSEVFPACSARYSQLGEALETALFSLCTGHHIQTVITNGMELTQAMWEQCCGASYKKSCYPFKLNQCLGKVTDLSVPPLPLLFCPFHPHWNTSRLSFSKGCK